MIAIVSILEDSSKNKQLFLSGTPKITSSYWEVQEHENTALVT